MSIMIRDKKFTHKLQFKYTNIKKKILNITCAPTTKLGITAYACKNDVTIQFTSYTQDGQTTVEMGGGSTAIVGMHARVLTKYRSPPGAFLFGTEYRYVCLSVRFSPGYMVELHIRVLASCWFLQNACLSCLRKSRSLGH